MKLKIVGVVLCAATVGIIYWFGCGSSGTPATAPYISAITKTSSVTAGTTTIELMFTYNEAITAFDVPTVNAQEVVQANVAANVVANEATNGALECSLDAAGTMVTCTLPIDNCRELHDYSISVSGATDAQGDAIAFVLNSADDEFDNGDSLANCWDQSGSQYANPFVDTASDTLQWNFNMGEEGMELTDANLSKTATAGQGLAMTMRVAENTPMGDNLIGVQINPVDAGEGESYRILANGGFAELGDMKLILAFVTNTDDANIGVYAPSEASGAWSPMADYTYFCIVKRGLAFSFYASTDGRTFVQMTDENTDPIEEGEPPTALDALWLEVRAPIIRLFAYDPDVSSGYDPKIDYIRFRTKNLAGTADDCPAAYLAP